MKGLEAIELHFAHLGSDRSDVTTGLTAPLERILAFRLDAPARWWLVTAGLTWLDDPPERSPISGWGQELTLCIPRGAEAEPPSWAIAHLSELASALKKLRRRFEPRSMPRVTAGFESVAGYLVVFDPEVDRIEGPFGAVTFVHLVGLTQRELDDAPIDPAEVQLYRAALLEPLKAIGLVTDPARRDEPRSAPRREPRPESAHRIEKAFGRIEGWLSANAPKLLRALRKPVRLEVLEAVEAHLGLSLPEELRVAWLCHDGLEEAGLPFFSAERMSDEWDRCARALKARSIAGGQARFEYAAQGPVRAAYWHQRWLPISGLFENYRCLDLDPAPGGSPGQVIRLFSAGWRAVELDTLTTLIEGLADALWAGEWQIDPYGRLEPKRLGDGSSGLELDVERSGADTRESEDAIDLRPMQQWVMGWVDTLVPMAPRGVRSIQVDLEPGTNARMVGLEFEVGAHASPWPDIVDPATAWFAASGAAFTALLGKLTAAGIEPNWTRARIEIVECVSIDVRFDGPTPAAVSIDRELVRGQLVNAALAGVLEDRAELHRLCARALAKRLRGVSSARYCAKGLSAPRSELRFEVPSGTWCAAAEVIGSYSRVENTWYAAFANRSYERDDYLRIERQAHEARAHDGTGALWRPGFYAPMSFAWRIAMLAAERAGAHAMYPIEANEGLFVFYAVFENLGD